MLDMEAELLSQYRETGDLKMLYRLFEPYKVRVFRMCMHYLKHAQDSEDAVMDIFIELKDKLRRHEVVNLAAWLHTLVRNHCLKKLNKRGKELLSDKVFSDILVETEYKPDQVDKWLERLPEAIDQLDERQRWCIVLFYLHGKNYKEIELEMDYSAMQVKSAIQNGKIKLRKILGTDEEA